MVWLDPIRKTRLNPASRSICLKPAAATAPDQVVAFSDWLEHLLSLLDQEDPTQRLRATALLKLEGCTDAEIATRHTCSRKTVVLRLGLIRSLWAELSNQ